ncbi:unnamed protein product [Parascedosporium putredinis]|uniref:Uncharacterized protein n=1 Tax=Parascedosporium putredinis TaxID=1442378 RepID=A0A9P1GZ95_9PEZI|nr:unnamed protein product [Parascedosporium putredinis]CAI7991561.1 unnamed protein product [Parascedosporium putredinis]
MSASRPVRERPVVKPDAAAEGADDVETPAAVTFTAEEEADLVKESNDKRPRQMNCSSPRDYELAVLKCNVSACHLKLEEWKEAADTATASLDGLDRIGKKETKQLAEGSAKDKDSIPGEEKDVGAEEEEKEEEDVVEEEIISTGAAKAAPLPITISPEEEAKKKREEDVKRIRAKALMRRARARSELGGWRNLAGAEEDYKILAQMDNLGPSDRKIVMVQLRLLPPRTKAAQEAETAEMWGN